MAFLFQIQIKAGIAGANSENHLDFQNLVEDFNVFILF